jgi:hypothetical protein
MGFLSRVFFKKVMSLFLSPFRVVGVDSDASLFSLATYGKLLPSVRFELTSSSLNDDQSLVGYLEYHLRDAVFT